MSAANKPASPIRVYSFLLSGHAHRVRLFLSLLGLPSETVDVDLAAGAQREPAFLALNPLGQVPVIDDGGTVIADSNAILVYSRSATATRTGCPDDPAGAAVVQRWLSYAAGPIASGPPPRALRDRVRRAARPGGRQAHGRQSARRDRRRAGRQAVCRRRAADDRRCRRVFVHCAHAPEGGVSLEPYPHVRAWLARIEALPGFVAMPTTRVGLLAA